MMDDLTVEIQLIERLIKKYKELGKEDVIKGLELALDAIEEAGSITYDDFWNMNDEEVDEEILKPLMDNHEKGMVQNDNRMEVQGQIESLKAEMIGFRYRHFKGNIYVVTDLAVHSETEEPVVLYKSSLDSEMTWCRPLNMFLSEVNHEKYPEVKQKIRFEKIEIKILNVEPTTDTEYGKSIVKYTIPDKKFTSYIFSSQSPDEFDIEKCEDEIAEYIKNSGGEKEVEGFPLWSDLSQDLIEIIKDSGLDMKFIEFDDEDWNDEKAEKVLSEASKYPSLQNVICAGEDDAYITVYAAAICSVNWYN